MIYFFPQRQVYSVYFSNYYLPLFESIIFDQILPLKMIIIIIIVTIIFCLFRFQRGSLFFDKHVGRVAFLPSKKSSKVVEEPVIDSFICQLFVLSRREGGGGGEEMLEFRFETGGGGRTRFR